MNCLNTRFEFAKNKKSEKIGDKFGYLVKIDQNFVGKML